MNKVNDQVKAAQLRRHKAVATGLFLLMAVVYVLSAWLLKSHNHTWLGYLKAFSEAAMVGALADWFAVTALFHHPLGIPIPHTNLIENRKKSIGDNLGGFVVSNFLNATTIRPYIGKLNISTLLIQWLGSEKNTGILVTEISRIAKDVIQNAEDKAVTGFISNKSKELLKEIKLNEVLASGLEIIMKRGDQVRILDYLVNKLRNYVTDNEAMVKERVKKESHFLIPGFVDNMIASKITHGLAKYMHEIETDPNHKIRNEVNEQLTRFINDIRTNPKWQQELQEIKDMILNGDKIQQYAFSIWKHLQSGIINDLEAQESAIQLYLKKTLLEMATNLKQDEAMQHKLNAWVRQHAYKYILQNTKKAGELISHTVGNWEGKELSNKLELEVGKDLQFIRINGTLVGGLVGLVIYTITKFIEHL
ncbi:MAG TPA: DUF445 domain-containing protein [Niabella sp.]|nr:DUF445 domain-containing protein [Niabella sp.]